MSRFIVTGATGFLGRHLVTRLRGAGHEVVALCRRPDDAALAAEGVILRPGDVLDAASVRAAAEGCEGLFHCAGKVSRRAEDAEELYRVHVEGTKITLDACRAAGVKRVVLASTSGVVAVTQSRWGRKRPHTPGPSGALSRWGQGARGRSEPEVRNEEAETPIDIISRWPYYRSKLYAEKAALDRNGPGFEVIAVNPTLLLGPGDEHGSSTGDVVKFLERKVPIIPAGGMSFVDVRDAAEAIVLAYEKGRPGQRYLISAINLTIEAFFGRLERISGVPGPRLRLPRSVALARAGAGLLERAAKHMTIEAPIDRISAEMAQHFWYVDATKANKELGWTPRDPSETLADTVDDLRQRGVVWP